MKSPSGQASMLDGSVGLVLLVYGDLMYKI